MIFLTELIAKDPLTGELKKFGGPDIEAPTWSIAQQYCQDNGLGYLKVVGKKVAEIPTDDNYNPQFDKMVDYELALLN